MKSIRALFARRSKNPIEIVRSSYLPRLNSQSHCARRGRENLFHIEYTALNVGIVENGDTGNFGNRSLSSSSRLPLSSI